MDQGIIAGVAEFVTDRMTLYRGNREIQIRVLSRGAAAKRVIRHHFR